MTIPDAWTQQQIDALLVVGTVDDLALIPIAITNLGTPDAAWSEAICLKLASHPEPSVRGNAVLGLGHLARTTRSLSRDAVLAVVAAALRDPDPYVRGHGECAADDIGIYMKWRVPTWDDLYARWRDARDNRSPAVRSIAETALARIRDLWDDDLAWLSQALADPNRRWFVAGLFRQHPLPRRLLDPMMSAALADGDASAIQHLVRPCAETFGPRAVAAWLDHAETIDATNAAHVQKARYWANSVRVRRGPWKR